MSIQRFFVSRQISSPEININRISASGGVIQEGYPYRFHYFTTPGDFVINFSQTGIFDIFMWGGGGGGGQPGGWTYGAPGGGGGFASATITSRRTSYVIKVGAGGLCNGLGYSIGYGGASKTDSNDNRYAGQGGGLSGIFHDGFTVAGAVLIAGGGGGGGASRAGTGNQGGAGGGLVAQDGSAPYDGQTARRGRGGAQTGPTALPTDSNGLLPSQFNGGVTINYGGGGGGGWWGGSAGTYAESNTMAGGGGGSGYANQDFVINAINTTGNFQTAGNTGSPYWSNYGTGANVSSNGNNGAVIIRYIYA